MKQLISSDRALNNMPQSPDLSTAECTSSPANKRHFAFDEAPNIFISNPFSECKFSEPYVPSSLAETSNIFAKSVLSLASTSGLF